MMNAFENVHAAPSVAQHNQGRVHVLGRGICSKSSLQSPNHAEPLVVLQCNINGLTTQGTRSKLEEVIDLAEQKRANIIALQETKLNAKCHLKVKGFNILRKDRPGGQGGGIALLIRSVNFEEIDFNLDPSNKIEIQGIRCFFGQNKCVNIFNIYVPPDSNPIDINFLEREILKENTLITGDFNAKHTDWGCTIINRRGSELLNLLNSTPHFILNDGTATHHSFSYNTAETIDLAIASEDLRNRTENTVLEGIGSDHKPVLTIIHVGITRKTCVKKHWNFRKADWDSFRLILNSRLEKRPTIGEVEEDWKNLKEAISFAAKKCIPRGKRKFFSSRCLDKDEEIKNLICKRKALENHLAFHQDPQKRTELNKIRATIARRFASGKRARWQEMCKHLDHKTSNTKLWKILRNLDQVQDQEVKTNSIRHPNGNLVSNNQDAANLLCDFYCNESTLSYSREDNIFAKKTRKTMHDIRCKKSTNPLFDENIKLAELNYALKKTDPSKSPGPDGLFGHFMLNLGSLGKDRLLSIFNTSLNSGKLPRDWKTASIIPILKPGKDIQEPKSYRPIALTSIACKIMERILLNRLQFHLKLNNLHMEEQCGFKQGHSTMDQVLYFTQRVKDQQNAKPTRSTLAVFLDLCQAFDRVWHNKLLFKLYDTFKIDGKVLLWIKDFLKQRTIRVNYKESFSRTRMIRQGVPQGSVLSPTLFALYLQGISSCLTGNSEISLFADDIIVWCSQRDPVQAEKCLEETLENIDSFFSDCKILLNPLKSEVSTFTTNRRLFKYAPNIKIGGKGIRNNQFPKYLGITLDPEINCTRHITSIAEKARKRLNMLKFISGRSWGADAATLKVSYETLVRPVIEYGLQIFSTASISSLEQLNKVQTSAARIIAGLRNSCPNDIAQFEAGLIPLDCRRKCIMNNYLNRLRSYESSHRTANYIKSWKSNQRLKKESPLSGALRCDMFQFDVEPTSPFFAINPLFDLSNVHFNKDLAYKISKSNDNPVLMRMLGLEMLSSIPPEATRIFTDGSKLENGSCGSGSVIFRPNKEPINISRRTPNHSSSYRAELIAILDSLRVIGNDEREVWLMTDSLSALQYLENFYEVRGTTAVAIVEELERLSRFFPVHLVWIPSHVGLAGNELADGLARAGCDQILEGDNLLTYSEIGSIYKKKAMDWSPPQHSWYGAKKPGEISKLQLCRQDQTALSRFRTGHTMSLKFEAGTKLFPDCPNCRGGAQASPEHILHCLGLTWKDLNDDPLFFLDLLRVTHIMELV